MTAIEELRRLLDERGVEWSAIHNTCTSWQMPVGNQMRDGFRVPVWYDGTLHIECVMSPTQAIAATLGRETCYVKAAKKIEDVFGFSLSCGHSMVNLFDDHPDYCPWCGARVVE